MDGVPGERSASGRWVSSWLVVVDAVRSGSQSEPVSTKELLMVKSDFSSAYSIDEGGLGWVYVIIGVDAGSGRWHRRCKTIPWNNTATCI